jgi:glutathione-specific gamma-glutamylcyclotransferase
MEDRKARPVGALAEYAPAPSSARPLKPTELLATLRTALEPWQPGTPFWIFAYGSLMWNPRFTFDARHVATIRGYHRSFRLWSRINRGTPENPGLVLTLECGGSCRGLVYRIAPDLVQEQMNLIWKREMMYGSYRPKWLNCVVGDETIKALCFTVNRYCSGYTGVIPEEVMVEAIASAAGRFGPAHDYLFKTVETLHEHGIRDARVEKLSHLVKARIEGKDAA